MEENKDAVEEQKQVQNEATTEENSKEETQEQAAQETKKEDSIEDKLKAAEDKYLRLFSEFENFRRRTQKEKADLISGAAADVFKLILPILDDFDRAKENIDKATDVASLKEGVDLIYNKIVKSLASNGLTAMDVKEKEFNADEHEAITNIPAPSEELKGKVVDVVEKGYSLNGKIIRFPKVVVGA